MSYRFLSSKRLAGVFIFGGEIRFGDRDEGTWQKHPENAHNKRSLIRTSHVYHRCRAAGRNQQVEEHKHTHTHRETSP